MPDEDGALKEEFALRGDPATKAGESATPDFRKIIEDIARRRSSPFEVFSDFVRMAACALASQTREKEYLEVAGRYSREELEQFSKALAALVSEMEAAPFTDVLGPYYIEVGSKFSRDLRGEFYTPKSVGDAIAGMLIDAPSVIEAGKPITVCDPASGSGGLVLSVAREFAQAKAVDLLRVTCLVNDNYPSPAVTIKTPRLRRG
jgi:type I restriction-modification system DNA methylase subunit